MLRKSWSLENIPMASNSPIYRNPRRDELADAQSLLDRTTIGESVNYEVLGSKSEIPSIELESNLHRRTQRASRPTIYIKAYDAIDDKITINEFFEDYERMSKANK